MEGGTDFSQYLMRAIKSEFTSQKLSVEAQRLLYLLVKNGSNDVCELSFQGSKENMMVIHFP